MQKSLTNRFAKIAVLLGVAITFGVVAPAAFANPGTPSFSGQAGGYWNASNFTLTVTSNPNHDTMTCYETLNGTYAGNMTPSYSSDSPDVVRQYNIYNNGDHNITCDATGSDGTTSSANIDFGLDNAAPSVSVGLSGGGGDNGWYNSGPSIYPNYGANGPSGISSASCTGIYQQGGNTITCYATSGAGITSSSSTTVYYDSVAPSISTSVSGGAAANGWYSSAPSISPNASDNASGVWYDSCTGLGNGVNYVTCSATDVAGNSATDGATQINLDNQTPTNSLPASTGAWYSASSLPALPVSASEGTNYSGVTSLSCTNPNDGGAGNYSLTQGVSASSTLAGTYPASDLAAGTNTITCTSSTGAGSTATSSFTVLYDPQTPTAQITSTLNSSAWYASAASIPTVSVSSTSGPSGIASIDCIAPGVESTFSTASGTVDLSTLRDGADTITCTPLSAAGVSGTPVTLSVQLDSQTPSLSFAGQASQTKWYDSASDVPELDTDATTGPSGLASIACSGDGIANQVAMFSGAPVDLTGLNQGSGTLTCVATSGSGLTNTKTFALNLDSSTPTVAWSTSASQTNWYDSGADVPSVSAQATAGGASGIAHIVCSGGALNGNLTVSGATATLPASAYANGTNTITCVPVSGAGVNGSAITRTVQVDTSAPAIALSGTDESTWYPTGQTVTADASADTNPSGVQSVSCSLDGGTAVLTNNATATQAVNADGAHTVSCHAISGAGVAGQADITSVKIDSQVPTTTQTIVPAGPTDPQGTVDVDVTAAETNSLSGIASTSCSLDGQTPTVVTGTHQTISISSAGQHSLDCTSTTGAGVTSTDSTQTYTVNADPNQFTLNYGTVASSWQTGPVAVPVSLSGATASNYRSLTCSVNSGTPSTITGTSGTVTVAASGTDELQCYATGANGADTAALQQLVKVDNQTPTATWSSTTTSTGDEVTLYGSEQTPLSGIASESCSIDGASALTSTSGTLQMAVTGNGTHQIACTITTQAGVSATVNHSVTLSVPVTPPNTVSAPDPGSWYHSTQTIVIGIPTSGPTVVSVVCTQGGISTTYPVDGTSVSVPVAAPGGEVDCYDVDSTGAQSAPVSFLVHIDEQAPTGYFIQTGTTQAIVSVTDGGNGSGVKAVTVQYQLAAGPWVAISGTYDATTGQEVVSLPAALLQPGVQYSLQALAVDYAGNQSVIDTMKDGSPANNTAPNPYAGAAVSGGLYIGTVPPGARMRVVKLARVRRTETKTVGSGKRRVKVTVTRKRYVWEVNRAKLANTLTSTYGTVVSLGGTLTLATGQVAHQPITVVQQTGKITKTSTGYTNASGGFNIKLAVGGTRTIKYTVAGVSRTVKLREHGKATLHSHRSSLTVAIAGATGKVRYRVQHLVAGHWRPLAGSRRTNAHGRARVVLSAAIAATSPTRLRVLITTQKTWPYLNLKDRA